MYSAKTISANSELIYGSLRITTDSQAVIEQYDSEHRLLCRSEVYPETIHYCLAPPCILRAESNLKTF